MDRKITKENRSIGFKESELTSRLFNDMSRDVHLACEELLVGR